jgi:Alpha/beta hydrolase domain
MSWSKRRASIVPRAGTALVAVAGLVVLFPLTLATQQAAGAVTAASPEVAFHGAATLTGPITTGQVIEPLSAHTPDLVAYGYVEQEYFAAGRATAFKADSTPSDGKWTITPTTSAAYKTRILVRRPKNPAHFNGTVVVEWLNVTDGESDPDWLYLNPMLMRDGYAYVGVSAQAVGIDGGKALIGSLTGSGGLVTKEPSRYGSLHHPGDQYAQDIFAQIGQALRAQGQMALGGLEPKHIVATGESQSAIFLTTFADAVQPRTDTFDGIFLHSRFGFGASLGGSISPKAGPDNLRIRTDLKVPTFMAETQTDVMQFGYALAQQPDTDKIRTWEMAGTSHADQWQLGTLPASIIGCTAPINTGPMHSVVQAAFTAFDKWAVDGTPPPSPPPFRQASTHPVTLALDAHGNVIGGVRTPAVDVPVSTLSGTPPAGASPVCQYFGSTVAFTPAQLAGLYGTRNNYIAAHTKSLDKAIAEGYLLEADKASFLAAAQQVPFPAS